MEVKKETLNDYLVQIRRISEHREADSEKNIRKIYKNLLKDLQGFLGIKYAQLAEDDKLDYGILQTKGEYARFLEEVQTHIDTITPDIAREITGVVNETYKTCYDGMVKGVAAAVNGKDLKEIFKSISAATPETIKRAVENPISGLTLKDTLEKHRKEIIYDIKQNIGIGLANGDRMSTMARRISKSLDGDYKKSIRIVRTEVHRVREAGFHDSAEQADKELRNSNSIVNLTKTWRTRKDQRVRPNRGIGKKRAKNGADHVKMEGITVKVNEMFDLGGGIKTKAPGLSGDAKNDINDRCFLEYDVAESVDNSEHKDNNKKIIQTGGKFTKGDTEWYLRRIEESDEYYNYIRNRNDDIDKIAKNIKWNIKSVERIKNHLFLDKHLLQNGNIDFLDSDYDIAVAWQRLINGEYKDRDIKLLKHEYLESVVEKKYNISNKEAHYIAVEKHNWDLIIRNEKGGYGEDDCLVELIRNEK